MRILLAIGLLFTAMTAQAAPVYLQCDSFNAHSNKTTHYTVTLDEATQTAVFSDDSLTSGKSYTVPAQFAQTDVKFNWTIPGLKLTMYYRIDRTTMEFSSNFMGNPQKTDVGMCKIAEPVKRQF